MILKNAEGKDVTVPDELLADGALAALNAGKQAIADNAAAKKAADDAKIEADRKVLEGKGAYEILSAEAKAEKVKLADDRKSFAIEKALVLGSIKAGMKKDNYLALVDRSSVSVNDKGEVVGVNEALEKCKKDNPDCFGEAGDQEGTTGGGHRKPPAGGGDAKKAYEAKKLEEAKTKQKPRHPEGW
jgi:hypothetical protein